MKNLIVMAIFLTGCTNADISRSFSSGLIGCPVEKIEIKNEDSENGVHTWIAVCNGMEYACSYFYPNPAACTNLVIEDKLTLVN